MMIRENDYEIAPSSSVSSVSSNNKENRLVKKILGDLNKTLRPPTWLRDDIASSSTSKQEHFVDIDEQSVDTNDHDQQRDGDDHFDIEEDCSTMARSSQTEPQDMDYLVDELDTSRTNDQQDREELLKVIDSATPPSLKRAKYDDEDNEGGGKESPSGQHSIQFDERSLPLPNSPIRDYALPKLPDVSEDNIAHKMNRTVQLMDTSNLKSKRKLGPLSEELRRRIRNQKSAQTLSKFRALVADEQQQKSMANKESDMSEDFLAANVVASAWGVDMIMSKENPEIIFRKHEMKNE